MTILLVLILLTLLGFGPLFGSIIGELFILAMWLVLLAIPIGGILLVIAAIY